MLERLRVPLKPLADLAARCFSWIHPNVISIVGFLLGFIPCYFFIMREPLFAGIGMLIYISDFLDGAVARFSGKVSKFGEVLDASLDRVADAFMIFSVAWGGFIPWGLAFLALIGFYMVSYIRARTGEASARKVKLNIGLAQRGERLIIVMVASMFYREELLVPFTSLYLNSLEMAFVILAILTWGTAIFRLGAAYKKLDKI